MKNIKWKKQGNDIVSVSGDYKIFDKKFAYSVFYRGTSIGVASSQKEAGDIAEKHFNKQRR